jgi:nicotinamide riboside transporter PnuC
MKLKRIYFILTAIAGLLVCWLSGLEHPILYTIGLVLCFISGYMTADKSIPWF